MNFTLESENNQVSITFSELPTATMGPTGTVAMCASLLTDLTRSMFGHVNVLPPSGASPSSAGGNLGAPSQPALGALGLSGVGPGNAISVRVELPTRQMHFVCPANSPAFAKGLPSMTQRLVALLEAINARFTPARGSQTRSQQLTYVAASSIGTSPSANSPLTGPSAPIYAFIPPPAGIATSSSATTSEFAAAVSSVLSLSKGSHSVMSSGATIHSARMSAFPSQVSPSPCTSSSSFFAFFL